MQSVGRVWPFVRSHSSFFKATNFFEISFLFVQNSLDFVFSKGRVNVLSFPKFALRCVKGYVSFMFYALINHNFLPMSAREFFQMRYKL